MHERGDYAAALDYWRNALAAREAAHDVARTRIARWTVARGLRSLGRLDEAEAAQRALADELQAANAPDGYVFEELAEIALARGDRAAAQPWAEKALAILDEDADLRANDAARLARLAEVARPLLPQRADESAKRRRIYERLRAANPEPESELEYTHAVRAAGGGGVVSAGDRQGRQQGDREAVQGREHAGCDRQARCRWLDSLHQLDRPVQ